MKAFDLKGIDAIIFDLGKVIINLNTQLTEQSFQNIFRENYHSVMRELESDLFFEKYETGHISDQLFVTTLLEKSPNGTNESDIKKAWNAMLLDIPKSRLDLLKWAKSRMPIFCLSNTNGIHIEEVENNLFKSHGFKTLDPFFNTVYYSHQMGLRKPDPAIFSTLVEQENLKAEKTLFIDDTAGHLIGAREIGLKTHHLSDDHSIENLFPIS